MPKPSLALALLSLFTTPEKATEIEGDLLEQSRCYGKLWFVSHVVLTTVALFRAAVVSNLVQVSLLSYASYELTTKAWFFGIWPLRNLLIYELELPRFPAMIPIYLLLFALPFFVAAGLVRFLPRLGAQVAIGAIALFFLRLAVLQEGFTVFTVMIYVALPMLVGSVYANWKSVERSLRANLAD